LKGFTFEADEGVEGEEPCAIANGARNANVPVIVAAPATPAARSKSRREGWNLLAPGAGREVFAFISCWFWSSSAFFILCLPLQEASPSWVRNIAAMVFGEYPPEGLAQLHLGVKNFARTMLHFCVPG
jgi:hypothetical protein